MGEGDPAKLGRVRVKKDLFRTSIDTEILLEGDPADG
jgi:hypothetical protein